MSTLTRLMDPKWKGLFRIGAYAAVTIAIFIPIQSFVFITWSPPSTVRDWFAFFQQNKLLGLLDLDLLLIADQVLFVLILLALWTALKHANFSLMTVGLVLGLIGIAGYFASTAAFEMLSLSNQYAAATTDAEKASALAAGQTMLAIYQGTAFNVSYILGAVSGLMIAFVMLRSEVFSKATAYVGLAMNIAMLVPPTAGPVGLALSLVSLIPLEIWLVLVARRFFELSGATASDIAKEVKVFI